jgi:hypothetical protein
MQIPYLKTFFSLWFANIRPPNQVYFPISLRVPPHQMHLQVDNMFQNIDMGLQTLEKENKDVIQGNVKKDNLTNKTNILIAQRSKPIGDKINQRFPSWLLPSIFPNR